MDKLFRANGYSFTIVVNEIVKGMQVESEDLDGHIEIFTDLIEAKAARCHNHGSKIATTLSAVSSRRDWCT